MAEALNSGPFHIRVDQTITVSREGTSVQFTPGEADKASNLISMVMQMSKLKVLPPNIKTSPFIVRFNPSGVFYFARQRENAKPDDGLKFEFESGDELIRAFDIAVQKSIDNLKIGGGARAGVSSFNPPEPIIEGR